MFFSERHLCTHNEKNYQKKFNPQKDVKMSDVKTCYDDLRHKHTCELPQNRKDFAGFNFEQLDKAYQLLNISAYIFDCKITNVTGRARCLSWCSEFVEGGIRLSMLRYKDHLTFIKELKALFKLFQCGDCKQCFKQTTHLNDHINICNGTSIKHVWQGGVYNSKKS